MAAFQAPAFVEHNSANEIQSRMMQRLPSDISSMEGDFPWDFTMPTALEKAEMIEFQLVETLKIMHPMWAYGEWLDYHAKGVGIERKAANYAAGTVQVNGKPGIKIPKGFQFATPASSAPPVFYRTILESVIRTDGVVSIPIQAAEAGEAGNTARETVTLTAAPMQGIISVTNPEKITGGTEQETDDALRERIMEINLSAGYSFVGCDSDYVRWAKEVPGVGNVLVVPEADGPGTVKIVLLDMNGQPANQTILDAVYNHIVSPNDRLSRLAPIGALITVASPVEKKIIYHAIIRLAIDKDPQSVINSFRPQLQEYYTRAKKEGVLYYNFVASVLTCTYGVIDFQDLTLNGDTKNIDISDAEYPVTEDIDFTFGGEAVD